VSRATLTIVISTATIVGMFTKPKRLHVAWPASAGALLLLVLGLVRLDEAVAAVNEGKEALLFLVALLLLAELIDQSGFFGWAALHAARRARGSARTLHRNVFLLGTVVTFALSLDTTAVLLTPIVLAFAKRLRLSPTPYVITCAFVANGASLLLPVSNLTNLLLVHFLKASYAAYALRMLLPQAAALGVMYTLLQRQFAAELDQPFDADTLEEPETAIESPDLFRVSLGILALALVGFFIGPALGVPPYAVAFAAVAALTVYALVTGRGLGSVVARFPWGVFPFASALFVVVRAIAGLGVDASASAWFVRNATTTGARLVTSAIASAIGANVANNLPALMLAQSVLAQRPPDEPAIYGTLLGVDLGANLMPFASLATMLVLSSAEDRGFTVPRRDVIRVGLRTTPLVLATAIAALAFTFAIRP
jgi:arsenical pump membrane protein